MTLKVDASIIPEEALREVEETGSPVPVERDGRIVALLVSPCLLKILDEFEDRLDVEAYDKAKRESAESGEDAIPYEEVRKELGL